MNEQKFLDESGVVHLYNKLSLQDYPNNEILIGVINAIDETKANKEDVLRSIPFNKIFIGEKEWIGYYNIENADFKFIPGKTYTIIWDDIEYSNLICENWEDEYYGVGDMWGSSNTYPFGISTSTTYENRVMIYVYGEESPIEHSFYIYPTVEQQLWEEYYTKSEIDSLELITIADIDTICGASIVAANEVTY